MSFSVTLLFVADAFVLRHVSKKFHKIFSPVKVATNPLVGFAALGFLSFRLLHGTIPYAFLSLLQVFVVGEMGP